MSKHGWNVLGWSFSSVGAFVGIVGSLMMAHAYYGTSVWDFVRSIPILLFLSLTGRRIALETFTKIGEVNKEDRALSLMGLCLVFLGFLLQLVGTTCSYFGT